MTGPPAPDRRDRDRALFDSIAESWCRKDLLPATRRARRHRLLRTLRCVPATRYEHVLEIGCGAGFAARYLEGRYARFTGIDPSEKLIELARVHNGGDTIEFHACGIEAFDPPADSSERFDVIFMIGVLHHIPNVEALMPHVGRLLRPGGWLVVNEPQPANPIVRLARATRKRLESAYSDEQDQISAAALSGMMERAGVRDVRLRAQGFCSTPFAEVVIRPIALARLAAPVACAVDTALETTLGPILRYASWNLIAAGRRPERPNG